MGIRMHLSVGYGLSLSEAGLSKARLNWEVLEDEALFVTWKRAALAYANEHHDSSFKFAMHGANPPTAMHEMTQYDDEFGDEDKLLLFPAGYRKEFSRYGDLLDIFAYEAERPEDCASRVPQWVRHPGCLYPFTGLMRASADAPLGIEDYWEPCWLDKEEHQDAIPTVPRHLWFWLKHVFRLGDEHTSAVFLQLRPHVCRHFS